MKNLILYTLILLGFGSCIPDPLPLKIPQAESKVVVFSQIIPNRVMIVSLTRSFSALDFNMNNGDTMGQDLLNSLVVDSALVTISYDNKTDTLFNTGLGLYVSINTLQTVGKNYRLEILTKQGERVSSNATIQQQVTFDSIQPKVIRTIADTTVTIRLRFTDLPGINYYMVNYYTNNSGGGIDFNNFFSNGSNVLTRTDLISDLELEEGVYAKTIELDDVKASDSLAVSLSNISEDYYQYLIQRKQSGKLVQQIFNEPINYRTNISNGYGFFNAHYPDLYFFELKKY